MNDKAASLIQGETEIVASAGTVPNPLHCGCGAKGFRRLDHGEAREQFTGIHVALCRLHESALDLLIVVKMAEAAAAMEVGEALAPEFGPRELLEAARSAIAKAEGR